jgi:hypothetical protein
VDQRSREVERKLEPPLLALALLTIPAIALEYSDAGEPWEAIGIGLNWAIWLAFVAEVVIMLRVVPDRGRWLRDHPLDLAIVIFTPPFLPASLQAARVFRLLRLLRLAKAGVLARRVFSTEGVRDAAVLTLLAVLGAGAAFAAVEKEEHLSAWGWRLVGHHHGDHGRLRRPGRERDHRRRAHHRHLPDGHRHRFRRRNDDRSSRTVRAWRAGGGTGPRRTTRHRGTSPSQRRAIEERLDQIIARLDSLERRGQIS